MESELGVTPERILVAMAAMNPKDLAEPASVTSESFVDNLNLDPASRPKAFQLYNQLLVDKGILKPLDPGSLVAEITVNTGLNTKVNPIQGDIPFVDPMTRLRSMPLESTQQMSASELLQPKPTIISENIKGTLDPNLGFDESGGLKENLDPNLILESDSNINPNSNFNLDSFSELNPKESSPSSIPLNAKQNVKLNTNELANGPSVEAQSLEAETDDAQLSESFDENEPSIQAKTIGGSVKSKEQKSSEGAETNVQLNSSQRRQKLNDSIDKMNDSFFMNADAQKKIAQQANSELTESTVVPFNSHTASGSNLADDVQAWQQAEAMSVPDKTVGKPILHSGGFENSKTGDFESEMDKADLNNPALSSDDPDFQSQVYGRLNSEWEPNKPVGINSDSHIKGSEVTNVDKVKNMQRIIENAKILTQNGGGEMQMKLSPEGLGDMQLKVIVANGKVDLELKTQNHEVKKLMESTINELKSSLAQHSLSVDKVKVDVGAQDSNSSGDSFLKQFQMNDNREQARQFLGQFRENNSSQRNNMFDLPGFKNYQSQRGDDLEPVSNRNVRPRVMEGNKGQGLNLVA
jgi:flagellar hook-length control protein FliK